MTETADGIPGEVFESVWDALEDSPAAAATSPRSTAATVRGRRPAHRTTRSPTVRRFAATGSPLRNRLRSSATARADW